MWGGMWVACGVGGAISITFDINILFYKIGDVRFVDSNCKETSNYHHF